jgi:hypothetical protein
MSLITNWISGIDIVGHELKFTYKGHRNYKTVIGGTLSLVIFLLSLAGLLYFGSEIYLKNNPLIISGSIFNEFPSNTSLNSNNFPFYVAVQDPTDGLKYFKDDTVYTMKARIYKRIVTKNQNNTQTITIERPWISLETCNLTKHFPGMEEVFSQTEYHKAYCLSDQNLFMKGDFVNKEFYEIIFYLFPCANSTSNFSCKNQSYIDSKIGASYVDFHYGYYFYNPKNYTTPLKREKLNYFTTITNQGQKKVATYLKKINYTTDTGLLTQSFRTDTYTQLDNIREILNPITPKKGDYIFSMDVRLSFTEDTNIRSYMKLQSLLAIMGGLFNGLIISAFYINEMLFRHIYWIDIINENFRIPFENLEENSIDLKTKLNILKRNNNKSTRFQITSQKIAPKPDITSNDMSFKKESDSKTYHQIKDFNILKEKYEKCHSGKKLHFSNFEFCTQLICCCSSKNYTKKKVMLQIGKRYIKEILDINVILKKQMELDKLKYIVLDWSEIIVFNSLPYPNLRNFAEDQVKDTFFTINTKYDSETLIKVLENYKSDDRNSKILKLHDKNILDFLEEGCFKFREIN